MNARRLPSSHPLTAAVLAALVAVGLPGCGEGRRAAYPSRPVFIICPWGVGGGTDTVSRFLANLLEKETGQSVSVINRTGGGGVTGHTAGAVAKPNGHTILTITVEIAMMHHRGLTSIGPEQFEPVTLINRDAAALFVRDASPWRTWEDLRRDIAASPGSLRCSGTAIGGIWHLAMAGLLLANDLPADSVVWVPSNGAGPSLQELMSESIQLVVCSLPEAAALLGAGRLRCLGVMAKERLDRFADVPTFIEQGVDWTLGGWRGFALPKGTPPEVVASLEAIVKRVVEGEEFRTFMEQRGFDASVEGSAQFAQTMRDDDEKFGRLIRETLAPQGEQSGVPGPWFFPSILAAGLAVVGAALFVARRPEARLRLSRDGILRVAEVLVPVVVYLALAETVGFLIVGSAIAVWLFKRLGNGWRASLAMTAVLVPGIYALFAKLMRVPLPEGLIPW